MHDNPIAVEADITTLAVDTIVNAANNSLLGGGVDGGRSALSGATRPGRRDAGLGSRAEAVVS